MHKKNIIRYIILTIIAFVAYGDTLTLKYASDDRMIIFENDYTLTGDVKNVMTKDAFTGYFGDVDKLVAGGRYRPLSQLTFMLEYKLFGGNIKDEAGLQRAPQNEKLFSDSPLPVIQHAINVLYFIVLCFLILMVLQKIFPKYENEKWYCSLPFLATLIFMLHPLHTEAVANIKGRDEIMCMLGAMAALYCSLRYVEKRQWWWLILSFIAMLFGIFSKENAITFIAVVPLALFLMSGEKKWHDYVWTLVPLVAASLIFLAARSHALGGLFNGNNDNQLLLNNPFVNSTKGEEIATVLVTWAIYLRLMIFPHPLTHDYYPNQIEITNFSNPVVWLILILILALAYFVIRSLIKHYKQPNEKRRVTVFAIAFFIITFSITSNLLFNLGTFMNERFLFMPLLGFALLVAYGMVKLVTRAETPKPVKQPARTPKQRVQPAVEATPRKPIAIIVIFCLLCGAYTAKTAVRNLAWHDDATLFTTDVETSSESMKCTLSAGGSFLKLYEQTNKQEYLKKAEKYLKKANKLGRNDTDTWNLLGKMYCLKKDYVNAAQCYQLVVNSTQDDPALKDITDLAKANLASMNGGSANEINKLIDQGKRSEALAVAQMVYEMDPDNAVVLNQLGRLYGEQVAAELSDARNQLALDPNNQQIAQRVKSKENELNKAIGYLEKAIQLDPDYASACENLGIAYATLRRFGEAIPLLEHAMEIFSKEENREKDLKRLNENLTLMRKEAAAAKH